MLVEVAKNLTLMTMQGNSTVVFTDSLYLNGLDRVSVSAVVHAIFGQGGAPEVQYLAQVSNDDGATWFDSAVVEDAFTAAGSSLVVGAVIGAQLRFKILFHITGGSSGHLAACCLSLAGNLDHA